ncbi:glycosyltransferase [Asaia prunellae]|uniref:glycosyltransferase n=1 Tax=Asaia prunellae TaxID=610245 RepID=UPI00046FD6C9|nr:glycosyltransferase [Asaia prunellae]
MSVITSIERGPAVLAPRSVAIVLRDFRLGGSERVAIGLANYWASRQIHVTLVVGCAEGPLKALVQPGIDVIDLALNSGLGDTRLVWALALRARAILRQGQVEACYVPGNSHWPVIPLLKTFLSGPVPRIVAQVSSPVCRASRSRLAQKGYDWRMRWLLGKADVITTLSDDLAREARRIIGCSRVEVVPLPALWDEGRPCAVAEGEMTILAAGRLVPIKGFDLLIDAFAIVARRHPAARLVICGEGPERQALETRIAGAGLTDRVTLTGYVPSIRPYLDRARLFVLSSHCESFGAVLVEALAAGRQIVSTRCSPVVDKLVTCPGAGSSVPVRDVPALAEAMGQILGQTPPECEALARIVAPYHVSCGGEAFLSLLHACEHDNRRATSQMKTGQALGFAINHPGISGRAL